MSAAVAGIDRRHAIDAAAVLIMLGLTLSWGLNGVAAKLSNGGYDPVFREGFEDWDFWIRVAAAGWPGRALGEPLVSYRKRPGSRLRRCEEPSVRPRLIRLLIERNRAIYERHFTDVVVNLSQQVLATQEAERAARLALHDVYRSRLGRLAGWAWAVRHDPGGRWAALLRRILGRPVEMP